MTNLENVKDAGRTRGHTIATYQEVRKIGSAYDGDIIETEDDQREAFIKDALEAETVDRDYTPFESVARELNDSVDPDEAWDSYEEGIMEGVKARCLFVFDNEPY